MIVLLTHRTLGSVLDASGLAGYVSRLFFVISSVAAAARTIEAEVVAWSLAALKSWFDA